MRRSVTDRFWSRVNKIGPIPKHCPELGRCWIWTGARKVVQGKKRYGELHVNGKTVSAHRLSYTLKYGPVPKGKHILHHCDNEPCIRPTHLYAGTSGQNLKDAYARGLRKPIQMKGEDHPLAKLTWVEVRKIRALHGRKNADRVAAQFKVSRFAIEDVWYGRSWKIQQEETQ